MPAAAGARNFARTSVNRTPFTVTKWKKICSKFYKFLKKLKIKIN